VQRTERRGPTIMLGALHAPYEVWRRAEMIEALREEEIVKKVGGRFKLSTLIQKRLVQINGGARPLVATKDSKDANKMQVVIDEILQDKIYLDTEMNVQAVQQPAGPLDVDFRNL
jgi:DNA-directed RNA polymerase subunit omega